MARVKTKQFSKALAAHESKTETIQNDLICFLIGLRVILN